MELQKNCKDDPTIDEDCDGYEEAMEELQNRLQRRSDDR